MILALGATLLLLPTENRIACLLFLFCPLLHPLHLFLLISFTAVLFDGSLHDYFVS